MDKIDINSPIFKPMLDELDTRIQKVIQETFEGKDFQSGEIAVKITLGTVPNSKDFPVMRNGKLEAKKVKYRSLDVKHTITTTLKKTNKVDGQYTGEKKLIKDIDDTFIEVDVEDPQITMFDK